jgi:pilus assembly protein CpaC
MRSTSFQQDRTELVFIITPHLVKPLQTASVPLPTDSFTPTNEADVFATGNMEGRGAHKSGAKPAANPSEMPQTPSPVPAPAQQPATPSAGAPGSRDSQSDQPVTTLPVPTPVSVAKPTPPTSPDAPTASHDGSAALNTRIARIESAAARIAAAAATEAGRTSSATHHGTQEIAKNGPTNVSVNR